MTLVQLRRKYLTLPLLKAYLQAAPKLSDTERTALEAGSVGFEGELFGGRPDWERLRCQPKPELSPGEQAFLDGPVETVCGMCNDWEITHERADLPPEVWRYLGEQRFFGLIIPKRYGGLGFSAYAHSKVLQKLASRSATLASNVCVPNSLGPAELLLHYGTAAQKDYYLPRLAAGEEIPCFALTGPEAGSDATAIPDTGVVCEGEWEGQSVTGIRLNFDKRYITLAPIATLIGVAFQLRDPEHLLGAQDDLGITLALVPRGVPGLEAGRRHLPLNVPFQNGPVRGKDVFVPLDAIIGGAAMAGQGWRMLVECLSVGRAISLPSNAAGGARAAAFTTGAYARIREQFGQPIGRFEGVAEALARIAGNTYALTALTRASAACVDRGEKPAVVSAIAKYHTTEWARRIAADAMDVHGGKGIVLGPRNYLGRGWQGAPIPITVEGANILTRSLMIFGQGAIRCHPYLLKEMEAAQLPDPEQRLAAFDKLLFAHARYCFGNLLRAPLLALSGGRPARIPKGPLAKHYRRLSRYSAALALSAETALLSLGAALKQRESLSARLGDVLGQLVIASALLKRFEDRGKPAAERPLLEWSLAQSYCEMEQALAGVCRNFPNRVLGGLLRVLVLPLGARRRPPSDALGRRVAALLMAPGACRECLGNGLYLTPAPDNPLAELDAALRAAVAAEPLGARLKRAHKTRQIPEPSPEAGLAAGLITAEEARTLGAARARTARIIAVDDFAPEALAAHVPHSSRRTRDVA